MSVQFYSLEGISMKIKINIIDLTSVEMIFLFMAYVVH